MSADIQMLPITGDQAVGRRANCKYAPHAIVGISPFNGYFTRKTITAIVSWSSRNFPSTSVYLPDEPAIHTLEALGYTRSHARRKARRQANYFRNMIASAIDAGTAEKIDLVDHSRLEQIDVYARWLAFYQKQMQEDEAFRQGILDLTRQVLKAKASRLEISREIGETQVLTGANYLLAELPVILQGAEILGGNKRTVFCYHRFPDFLKSLFQGELTAVSPFQSFLVLNRQDLTVSDIAGHTSYSSRRQ